MVITNIMLITDVTLANLVLFCIFCISQFYFYFVFFVLTLSLHRNLLFLVVCFIPFLTTNSNIYIYFVFTNSRWSFSLFIHFFLKCNSILCAKDLSAKRLHTRHYWSLNLSDTPTTTSKNIINVETYDRWCLFTGLYIVINKCNYPITQNCLQNHHEQPLWWSVDLQRFNCLWLFIHCNKQLSVVCKHFPEFIIKIKNFFSSMQAFSSKVCDSTCTHWHTPKSL